MTFADQNRGIARDQPPGEFLDAGSSRVSVLFVRNPRARRYILRLQPAGWARVTIPRGGSAAEARRFAERHTHWLKRQLERQGANPHRRQQWTVGTEMLFRGELAKIETVAPESSARVRIGGEEIPVRDATDDLRPAIERHLWRLAAQELPPRVMEFAAAQKLSVRRVTVRNQRSRWGSCSRNGTVSLNWRLIQAPVFVRDYLILHELMHLRQMNHSPRFWREVERVCPDYQNAEQWLNQHAALLR
jgi:predicted metal-dependent hydrolase